MARETEQVKLVGPWQRMKNPTHVCTYRLHDRDKPALSTNLRLERVNTTPLPHVRHSPEPGRFVSPWRSSVRTGWLGNFGHLGTFRSLFFPIDPSSQERGMRAVRGCCTNTFLSDPCFPCFSFINEPKPWVGGLPVDGWGWETKWLVH
jgi:hypothetical protein